MHILAGPGKKKNTEASFIDSYIQYTSMLVRIIRQKYNLGIRETQMRASKPESIWVVVVLYSSIVITS
jgi:hypothetical protein